MLMLSVRLFIRLFVAYIVAARRLGGGKNAVLIFQSLRLEQRKKS